MVYATLEKKNDTISAAIPAIDTLDDDEEHDIELGNAIHHHVDAISSNEDSERTDRTIDTYNWNEGSIRTTIHNNHEEGECSKNEVTATVQAATTSSVKASVCDCEGGIKNDERYGEDLENDDIESQDHEQNEDVSDTVLPSTSLPQINNSAEEKVELDDSAGAGDNPVCCLRVPMRNNSGDKECTESSVNDGSYDKSQEGEEKTHRCVDICCSICLGEYEVGDHVVYSSQMECQHVFHEECIMQWLCKGKKRCPICRNWFVPGISIAEQKEAAVAIALVEEAINDDDEGNDGSSRQQQDIGGDDEGLGVTNRTVDTAISTNAGIVIAIDEAQTSAVKQLALPLRVGFYLSRPSLCLQRATTIQLV